MANADRIRLVVHGDDFGLSAAANRGIWRAWQEGILTSASLAANGAAIEEACTLAAGAKLELGIHLNLTTGRPLLPAAAVPSLVDASGALPGKWTMVRRALTGRLAAHEVRAELSAQLERLTGFGMRLTHLDSHHHLHLVPAVAAVAAALAREAGIGWVRRIRGAGEGFWNSAGLTGRLQQAALAHSSRRCEAAWQRFRSADAFFGLAWYRAPGGEAVQRLLRALRPGLNEWMCHPADFSTLPAGGLTAARHQAECDLLCDPGLRRQLEAAGIETTTFEP